jgi:hypothetical protein
MNPDPIPEANQQDAEKAAKTAWERVRVALDERGITLDYLARKLKAELLAKETKVFMTKEGQVVYSDPLIAWDVRQRARQDTHRLRGDYPPEKKQVGGLNGEPIHLIIDDMSKKKAADPGDAPAPAEKELIDG